MSSACTPILVGVVSLISEILLPSKTAKFPFWGLDYSPWSSKNLIDRNWLKKFMHVCIDVKFMHTNFGGCGFSGFRDTAAFKKENLAIIEGSSISETGETTPTKIGVHDHQKI